MPRPISLAHLTVLDVTPPELVTVAAAGFRSIGIRLTATPSVVVPPYDCMSAEPDDARTLERAKRADRALTALVATASSTPSTRPI